MRTTVHLLRWNTSPNERDLIALRDLASATGSRSQIAETFRVVQRLDAALRLAAVLRSGDAKSLPSLRVSLAGSDPENALQGFALAIAESRAGSAPERIFAALPSSAP